MRECGTEVEFDLFRVEGGEGEVERAEGSEMSLSGSEMTTSTPLQSLSPPLLSGRLVEFGPFPDFVSEGGAENISSVSPRFDLWRRSNFVYF